MSTLGSDIPAVPVNPFRSALTMDQRATLDSIRARSITRFGFDAFRMEEPSGGGDPAPTGGDPTPTPTPTPTPPAGADAKFSQGDLDRIVQNRLAEQQRKHDKAIADLQDSAGKSELEKVTAERDKWQTAATTAGEKAGPKVANALAQVAAITSGGRADRADAIVRQADLDGVVKYDGDDFTVDNDKLTAAIEKVLTDYPEWKAEAAKPGTPPPAGNPPANTPPSSGGDLGGGGAPALSLAEFKKLGMGERADLRTKDPEAYRKLADAEIEERSGARR